MKTFEDMIEQIKVHNFEKGDVLVFKIDLTTMADYDRKQLSEWLRLLEKRLEHQLGFEIPTCIIDKHMDVEVLRTKDD